MAASRPGCHPAMILVWLLPEPWLFGLAPGPRHRPPHRDLPPALLTGLGLARACRTDHGVSADSAAQGSQAEQVFVGWTDGPLAQLPSGSLPASAAWLALAAISCNLLRAADALASLAYGKARGTTIRRAPPGTAAATSPCTSRGLVTRASHRASSEDTFQGDTPE